MSKKSRFTGRRKSTGARVKDELEPQVEVTTELERDDDEASVERGDDSRSVPVETANPEAGTTGAGTPASDEGDGPDEETRRSTSVVASKFKHRYHENAKQLGLKGKAVRRSNWDWLAQEIAKQCLDKDKLNVDRFIRLMDANGIDHSRWNNRNRGWEGRLRMTGRVALQRVVADNERLVLPDGSEHKPPAEFVEKYKTKD